MNQLQILDFQGSRIRMVIRDGDPWWVAADVCEALGIDRSQTRRLDDDERGVCSVQTPGGPQDMVVVNEPGLYSLILGARHREGVAGEQVRAFKRWVTHEVIPAIRRDGMYVTEALLDDPEYLLRVTQRLVEERRARPAAEAKVAELTTKAEFHDRVASSQDAISIREAAKVLGTGQNRLFAWLRGQRILMADNQPYQEYLDAGYFRVIEQTWTDKAGEVHLSPKTLVTGKGLAWLQKRWDAYHRPERALRVVETASHQ